MQILVDEAHIRIISKDRKSAQRSFHQVTESTVQQTMQPDLQFLRR